MEAFIDGSGWMNYFSLMAPSQTDIDGDGNYDLLVGGTDAARDYSGYANIAAGIFMEAASCSNPSRVYSKPSIPLLPSKIHYNRYKIQSPPRNSS